MYINDRSGVSAVLGRHYLLRYVIVERPDVAMREDAIAYLLLQERLDEIENRVDERTDVDYVHLLQFRRICLLRADQKLLH